MFLGRLRIRGKLTLLVIIPLLAVAGLVVPVVRGLVRDAARASEVDRVATVAERVGNLLADLQRERLLEVGYLLGVVSGDDVELQIAAVTDRVRDVPYELGDTLPAAVRDRIAAVGSLTELRDRVRARKATADQVIEAYAPLLDTMIESFELVRNSDPATEAGRQLIALDALLRLDESNTESTALLAAMAGGDVAGHFVRYHEERAEYDTYLDRFENFATPAERELYDLVAAAFQDRLGKDFEANFAADPATTMAALPVARLFPALRSFSVLGGFVKKRLADEVDSLVEDQRQRQLTIAYAVGALVLVVLLLVLLLVAAVARAVAVPLTQLSRAAELVAEAGETELRRIADDESETIEPVSFEVLDLDSQDEIGDLARVFERVQNTASQLVERQVLSRRNVAEMFGHIGRRTQNLVGGQVGLIDELENEETSPERLTKLYQLDHIANRLRRSADSLVVISGAEREQTHLSPVRLNDVARLALAEIEEYTRVDVDVPLDLLLAPALVGDMVLICGELLENATTFSPPHTRVSVSARGVPGGGARLVVTDHGIGIPAERLAEENARIARRERLDLVPTQVLGLFVVGRLARRHQLAVTLSSTPGGGVTVEVLIGASLLAGTAIPAAPAAPPSTPARAPMLITPEWQTPSQPGVRAAVSRASYALGEQVTWNGFDVPHQLPAAPAPSMPAPSMPAPSMPAPSMPAPAMPAPAMPAPAMPAPALTVQARPAGGPSPEAGLRQRVPGAQLPPRTTPAVSHHVPVAADAVAARDVVEAFELGVRSARNGTAPAPALATPGLNRRVPGATLRPGDTRRAAPPPLVHDPDAARTLVEQFEFGVTQALHESTQKRQ